MKKSFAQILESLEGKAAGKMASKLPTWHAAGCTIPMSLALEQCSSEAAAIYKTGITGPGTGCLADLTGGLGVDCWAFSRKFSKVLYFERNRTLAEEARDNFGKLGAGNIEINCRETCADLLADSTLGQLDCIYLDPARRDAAGKKVFLLEDCSPNILELLPLLWKHSSRILLKLSPMADISMIRNRLGNCLKEIHVVGLGGEVKELLCVLENNSRKEFRCVIARLDGEKPLTMEVHDCCEVIYDNPQPGMTLLEPGAILLKAGVRNIRGFAKPAPFTNLFLTGSGVCKEGLKETTAYCDYCKKFKIVEVHPLNKTGIKTVGVKYSHAEVSAKNIPMTSEELRRRLGCKSGGNIHIFGAATLSDKILIICEKD